MLLELICFFRWHETASSVFVQLIEHGPYIYEKFHAAYAMRDKIDWLGKEFLIRRSLDRG
jgi:hypothetical protein